LTADESKPEQAEPTAREFELARKRRNVMIAWMLVAFMVLVFAITALRFTQNMEAREVDSATQEVDDAPLDAE
jgi:hypothetical protein